MADESKNVDVSGEGNRLNRGTFLVATAGVVGTAAGLGGFASAAQARKTKTAVALAKQKPILIGGAFPLSGSFAKDGQLMRDGPQLAINEINAAGGINGRKLQLVNVDTDIFTPTGVTTALNKLVSKKVDAIICGFFVAQPPAWDVIPPYGCPYVNGNATFASTQLTASNPSKYYMMFQITASEIYYGPAMPAALNFLAGHGWKPSSNKVFIVKGALPYSQTVTDIYVKAFKAGGRWNVTNVEEIPEAITDWGPQLSKIKGDNPGVIIITHTAVADLAAFMKQFNADPTNSLVYIQFAPSVPEFRKLAGTAADGVIWSTVAGPLETPKAKAFAKKYIKTFHTDPGYGYAAIDYDEVQILADAWRKVRDTRDFKAVCKAIRSTTYFGLCGGYSLNNKYQAGLAFPTQTKDPKKGQPTIFRQLQSGKQKVVFPAPYTEAKFKPGAWQK